jgi:hypothetical protein
MDEVKVGEPLPQPEGSEGLARCFITFGLILAEAGVSTRKQTAAAFEATAKACEKEAEERGWNAAALAYLPRSLAEIFAAPVPGDRSGFRVIERNEDS